MTDNMYALVGNFGFDSTPKGVSVFRYDPGDGSLEEIGTFLEHVSVGSQCFDSERQVLYLVDERAHDREGFGGGGYILSVKIDRLSGECFLLNEKETLAPKPAYVSLSGRGDYALVAHHVNNDRVVRIVRDDTGSFSSETLYDDTPLSLFPISKDGSLENAADMMIFKGEGKTLLHGISHLHSVIPDLSGKFFIVCDKGLDRIYCVKIQRDTGSLILTHTEVVSDGSAPRYGVFHPTLPLVYINNESRAEIDCYSYDREEGCLQYISSSPLLLNDVDKRTSNNDEIQSSDILIHPSGKVLYATVRGVDCLSVFSLESSGKMNLIQNIPSGGINPRGLCLSPDGRFLFVLNIASGSIRAFSADRSGRGLKDLGDRASTSRPGNMRIITVT